MWLSSWASTPSSSTRFIFSSSPVVTAMAACFGLRPGGEGVRATGRRRCRPRLGQPAGDAEALDEVVEPGVLLDRRRPGPAHRAARWRRTSSTRTPPTPPASSSATTMKTGPPPRSRLRAAPTASTRPTKPSDQERGAALVLSDLVVHAGVRVLGGSEACGEAGGAAAARRRRGGGVPPRSTGGRGAEVDLRRGPRTPRRPRSTRARRS